MFHNLSKHPSNIAQAAFEYLNKLSVSEETRRLHVNILYLFIEHLRSDLSALVRTKDGEYLLYNSWDCYDSNAISKFTNWWLPRTVMNSTIETRAPGVLRKWIKWCYKHQYFDKDRFKDFMAALPKSKSKEVQRLQRASELLYRLHTPTTCSWKTKSRNNIVSINWKQEPSELCEGYMKVVDISHEFGFLETPEGIQIGPVLLGRELPKVLELGDVLTVEIGRYGKNWKVLDSGNIYAEGTIL
ncbi:MAG: hypothetical protein JW786_11760 [Desulfobacterales bacterium]|nr:hypothetical protein [Desulfobacterales bacterium]